MLAMLALAAPLPAFALSNAAPPADQGAGPASISVSTSLDSCGVLDSEVVCKLDVSFSALANADSYSAAVTSADGSVVDYGSVPPGGTSFWVPYVGAGTYSVRITAYGMPETPSDPSDRGNVVAIGDSGALNDRTARPPRAGHADATSATAADPDNAHNADSSGSTDSAAASASTTESTTPAPACNTPAPTVEPPPVAPQPPPPDNDPANPDEDGDGIPDATEQANYDADLAAYQAAVDAQQAAATPAPAPGC